MDSYQINTKETLQKLRQAPLLGEDAHCLYSPPGRPLFTYEEILTKQPRWAAVNILLYLKNERWHIPLMVRATNKKDLHSGQISLPGGKKENTDNSFAYTAMRETSEELGIELPYIRLIREISPIYIPPSNFYVHAYISYTKRNPKFSLQTTEATELIEMPVDVLFSLPVVPHTEILPGVGGISVPVISYKEYKIWGATSMILSEFSQLLKNM